MVTNAHATSILTCDRIASQNSRRISRPYSKKMSWLHDQQQYCLRCIPLRSPFDSKRLKLTSTCHFLLKLNVRGSDSYKHSHFTHFTKVRKSQQWINVLIQGESTTSSIQMVGKAISESMHQEDTTCDLISRSPGQYDLLLQCVWSPQLPYLQGLEQLLLSNLQPTLVLHIVNCTQWNAINSLSVLWNLLHPLRT